MILFICFSSSFAQKSSSRDCARSRFNVDLLNLYRFALARFSGFTINEHSQACRMQTTTAMTDAINMYDKIKSSASAYSQYHFASASRQLAAEKILKPLVF